MATYTETSNYNLRKIDGGQVGWDTDMNWNFDEIDTLLANHDHDGVYEPVFAKNTAFNKDFGDSAETVCEGNDPRLSDAREPTEHASSHGSGGIDELAPEDIGAAPLGASGETSNRPPSPVVGQMFFDTDLNVPIWFDGSDWVDAGGNIV